MRHLVEGLRRLRLSALLAYVSVFRFALIGFGCVMAGCARSDDIVGIRGRRELLVLPGEPIYSMARTPNGAMLVASQRSIYRAIGPDYETWLPVISPRRVIFSLTAISDSQIVGLHLRGVVRWTLRNERWNEEDLSVPDSLVVVSEEQGLSTLYRISEGHDGDFFAVGSRGTILRYWNGDWSREATPFDATRPSTSTSGFEQMILGVARGPNAMYAVAPSMVLSREIAVWTPMPGAPLSADGCPGKSVVIASGRILVSGGEPPCLFRFAGNAWEKLATSGIRYSLDKGSLQTDSSALFWSIAGEILEVVGTGQRVYLTKEFQNFRDAFSDASFIYAAGMSSNDGKVIRFNRGS